MAQRLMRLPPVWETQVRSLGREDPLEKEMVTHSSILAWRIPWTRSLVGYSPRGHKELDTTEQLHFTSGKKGNGKGGQSDLHASTFSSDSFSLKYSVRQGTLIWGSMF